MSEIYRPTEAEQAAAYEQICQIARRYALILAAAGGVATIVHPTTQREEGVYTHIQWLHGLGKHPREIERERAALVATAGAVPDLERAAAHYTAMAAEARSMAGKPEALEPSRQAAHQARLTDLERRN